MSNIDLTTAFSRLLIQINDENRLQRKQALERILSELDERDPQLDIDILITTKIIHLIFDNAERNRELTCGIIDKILNRHSNIDKFLVIIVPELTKKLADKDTIEPSEEIRYYLVKIAHLIVKKSGKSISLFVEDIVKAASQTLTDNYSEIKRLSCSIVNEIATLNGHEFYEHSEQLVRPLTANLLHQHSKVRLESIISIGNVLMKNNAKSFDQICSSLAQRLFDDNANVRRSVVEVFGKWLLDLPDRYSFHQKLIPVFLSGFIDDNEDIREMTSDLWHDIGMKYQHENETDLKDQIDFENNKIVNYPIEYERPNLGCRVLLFRTLSRILPALTRDLSDWSENTRIKSAKLLPYLILNGEGACTQHCQLLIGSTLIRGLVDEEIQVRKACRESSRLLGFFVEPKVWWHILQTVINRSDADDVFLAGEMILLSCLMESSDCFQLIQDGIINEICQYIKSSDICGAYSTKIKFAGLRCVLSIVTRFSSNFSEIYEMIGYELFYSTLSFGSFESQDPADETGSKLHEQMMLTFDKFTESLSLNNCDQLYHRFLGQTLSELTDKSNNWTAYSSDRLLCSKLLIIVGPVIGHFVDPVLDLFHITLNKAQELELRLKFFLTIVKLTSNINTSLNSQGLFTSDHLGKLLDSAILPNLMWQSGRTAEALRRVAITCLWSSLVGCCKSSTDSGNDNIFSLLNASVWHDLLVRQVSALDDDLKDTRMISAKSLVISLDIIKQYKLLSKNIIDQDYLHKIYPSFIKRMDDSFDEIRIITTQIIISWVEVLIDNFDANLYRAHVEELNSGILIHLDDSNREVQQAVYGALLVVSRISPSITESEVTKVRSKHRSPKYCDKLIAEIHSLDQ